MRHNELRDITAKLQEVCSDVQVEPSLQPLSGEHLSLRTANREDGVRLDVDHSVIRLIRCKLTFSLLRSTITCLRGSRSSSKSIHHTNTTADLALIEGRVCQ